jgi:hypothetical protein
VDGVPHLLLTLVLMPVLQAADQTRSPRAAEVAELIREVGGHVTLTALAADPPLWEEALRGIASGRDGWLEVGRELRRHSDAEASDWLDLALAEALEPAAAAVLEIADGTVWHVADACGPIGFAERGSSDGAYIGRFLAARSRAVRAVERADLLERREQCLEEIARAREDLLGRSGR